MKEPDVKTPSVCCQSLTARAAAQSYREAIRRRDFGLRDRKLLEVIIKYWLEEPAEYQPYAIIPRQGFFCLLTGLSKGKVSEGLDDLRRAHVVEQGQVEVVVSSRKQRWCTWCLNPPGTWMVRDLVVSTPLLQEVESWLNGLMGGRTSAQTEFLAPPPTLAQLLREDFASQCAGESRSRVEASDRRMIGSSSEAGSPGGNFGADETSRRVPSGGTVGDRTSVPEKGTLKVPEGTSADRSGSKDSGTGTVRSYPGIGSNSNSINRIEIERDAESSRKGNSGIYHTVSDRLWSLIGVHEKKGWSGPVFRRALQLDPDSVNELCGVLEEKIRLGTLRSTPGAWMNVSIRSHLAMLAGERS